MALNSEARFTSASLLSPLFLEISKGTKEKRLKTLLDQGKLKSSEKIYLDGLPYASIGDVFALAADIKQVLEKIQLPLENAAGLIENVSVEFTGILRDIDQLLIQVQPRILALMDHSDGFIQNTSKEIIPTLQNVRQTTDLLKTGVPKTISAVDKKVSGVLGDANGLIRSVSPELVSTVQSLRESMQQLRTQANSVEKRLSALLDNSNRVVVDNKDEIDRILIRLEKNLHKYGKHEQPTGKKSLAASLENRSEERSKPCISGLESYR